jgi:xanthine dehydrogenase YagS FAD-binding subunit
MKPFAYTRATSVQEAVTLLGRNGDGAARLLAGGTDLLTLIKAGVASPAHLVDIKRVADLDDRIEQTPDGLEIGALATLADLEASAVLREQWTALAEAAAVAATPQLRNMATIGGNLLQRPRCWYYRSPHLDCWLKGGTECPARDGESQQHAILGGGPCWAVHPSDLAGSLLALDTEARLQGPEGKRTLPIGELFAAPEEQRRTETVVRPDEILLSLRMPRPPAGTRSTYLKAMDRKSWSFALVGVASCLRLAGRRIEHARLVLTGVAPVPWRSEAAEQQLIGEEAGPDLFARAAEAALASARPLRHNAYKLPLARALIRRALEAVSG